MRTEKSFGYGEREFLKRRKGHEEDELSEQLALRCLGHTCLCRYALLTHLFSQTNELYQLASVAFCLLVAWCSDKLGLSLELGSFAAGVMISTTDLGQHTLEQVEPIRNFFAALFLASIGMLIHVHFLWNHVDVLLAAVILVIVIKTMVVAAVVKGFRYNNKISLLVRARPSTADSQSEIGFKGDSLRLDNGKLGNIHRSDSGKQSNSFRSDSANC